MQAPSGSSPVQRAERGVDPKAVCDSGTLSGGAVQAVVILLLRNPTPRPFGV